jgi:dienelactone hydrolase
VLILKDELSNGIRLRAGTIVGSRGDVPWALWTPEGVIPTQLILAGHGASGSKYEDYIVALARGFVRQHAMAVLAIDGPVQGDRANTGSTPFADFAAAWSSDEGLTDAMIGDWRRAIEEMLAQGVITRDARIGYWGLSMGTIFGLPLVAAEPRISACVLGLMGVAGPTRDRIAADAASISVPTLFLLQWDDKLFKRQDGLDLFDRIGAKDKTLLATPGEHAAVPAESFRRSAAFLVSRLADGHSE